MRIVLVGMCGHMGREVLKLGEAGYRGAEIVAGVDAFATGDEGKPCAKTFAEAYADADCIVDFSHHCLTEELLDFAVEKKLPVVLCTTGQTVDEIDLIHKAAKKIPVFFSANMSFGVALLVETAKTVAAAMPDADIEIIEKHHNRKLDAPSGTAKMIVDALCDIRTDAYPVYGRSGHAKRTPEEIGVHSLRMGNVVGEHEVIVSTASQTLTLKHEAHSRSLFAEGALAAAQFLCGKDAGIYTMGDMVK